MIIDDLSKSVGLSYIHTIYQTMDSELDLEKNCRNYPNHEYEKYRDCDDEFMLQELEEDGLIPFWATNNYSTVTKMRYLLQLVLSLYINKVFSLKYLQWRLGL